MPGKKKSPVSPKSRTSFGRWLTLVLGILVILVTVFAASMIAAELWITWPTVRERQFQRTLAEYRARGETAVPLTSLVTGDWNKACLIKNYEDATADAIRQTYGATVDTQQLSGEFQLVRDGEGAMVFYPTGAAPWAMRVISAYFDDLNDGDCVDQTYRIVFEN